jgi:beclin 1
MNLIRASFQIFESFKHTDIICRYTLHPRASFSAITQYPPASGKVKGDTYELYASTDLHLGRLLHNRRFDSGMVFFLDALRLIIAHVKETDSSVEFPHA